MKVGDLVQFDLWGGEAGDFFCGVREERRDLNKKMGIFLGERPLKRNDGVVIENFEVLLFGEDHSRLCDRGLRRWLKVVEE